MADQNAIAVRIERIRKLAHEDAKSQDQYEAAAIAQSVVYDTAPGTDTVSFVERVPAGAVNLTTVYAWRDSLGGFKAVHSRHAAIGGPTPSQQYGRCELW